MPKTTKQRNRVPLSCNHCRKKKIKCDRSRPVCTICIAHGTASSCNYYSKSGEINVNNEINLNNSNINSLAYQDKTVFPETPPINSKSPISTKDVQIAHLQSQIKSLQEQLQQFSNSHKDKNENKNKIITTTTTPNNANSTITSPSASTISQPSNLPTYNGPSNNQLANYIRDHLASLGVDINEKLDIYRPTNSYLNESKNSSNDYRTTSFNSGPFSWLSIISKDPLATPIRDAVILAKKDILTKFKKSALQKSFVDINNVTNLQPNSNITNLSNNLNQNETLQICKNIINILPNKRVIWLFIDRFFKYLYPFMPYLDQDLFIADIERIVNTNRINDLNSNFEIKITSLSLSEYPDLAIIGTLLIVLKFSYESLFTTDGSFVENKPHNDLEDYLIKFNQQDILIKYANQCLNQYLILLKRSPLPILQCALLFREYQKVNGCDVFVDGDSYIYTGLLIQIATTLGLNKEPSTTPTNDIRACKINQLKRKIWYSLVSADINQYTQMGIPPVIDEKFYNTKLPEFDPNATNVLDLSLEETTCNMLVLRFQVEKSMKLLADRALNMKESPKFGELVYRVIALENELRGRFQSLNDILQTDHQNNHYKKIEKVYKFSQYIHTLTFLLPIYIFCFYHYSERENFLTCFFLFNKAMSFWMFILGNLKDLIESPNVFFDYGFEIVLAPVIEIILSKTCVLPTTTIIRFHRAALSVQNSNPQLADSLKTFIKNRLVFFDSSVFATSLQLLSKRYFYAWRMYKIHLFLVEQLHQGMLDAKIENEDKVYNFVEHLSLDNVNQLSNIMDHRYFSARVKQPDWLLEWVKQVNEFIYDPSNNINFDNYSKSDFNDSSNNTNIDYNSFPDLETHDEMWFNKIFNKVAVPNTELSMSLPNGIHSPSQLPIPSAHQMQNAINPQINYNSQFQTSHQSYIIPQSSVFTNSHPSVNINNTMGNSYIFQANQMNQLLNMNSVNDLLNFYEPAEWSTNPTAPESDEFNVPPAQSDTNPPQ